MLKKDKARHLKKAATILSLKSRFLNWVLLTLFTGSVTTPAIAILSDISGQIQGKAPTVTGRVQVLFPDGDTVLADNAMLEPNQIPNQFKVSSLTDSLVLQDADGDIGLDAWLDTDSAIMTWKHDGTTLTSAQLAAPFGDNFAGRTLTLGIYAPATASSITGFPRVNRQFLVSRYTLNVASVFTGVSVNDHTFDVAEGFPKTGFIGAWFMLSTPVAASSYIWDNGDSSWVTVNDSGRVSFTARGNSTPVTITATPKTGGVPLIYAFSVNTWFIIDPSAAVNWNSASKLCTDQGLTLPSRVDVTFSDQENKLPERKIGRLWSEWGRVATYPSSGLVPTDYWMSDPTEFLDKHTVVDMYDGFVSPTNTTTNSHRVMCLQGI